MLKQFFFVLVSLSFVASSCQTGATDAQAEARANVAETTTPAPAPAPVEPSVAVPSGPLTTMEFESSTLDFGTVIDGEIVNRTFKFKNTGSEPLIISDAKGSCGCTVPQKPTAPIAPGDSGEITVQFNSKGKPGQRSQKVTVTANTNPAQTFVYLNGVVNPDPNAATQK